MCRITGTGQHDYTLTTPVVFNGGGSIFIGYQRPSGTSTFDLTYDSSSTVSDTFIVGGSAPANPLSSSPSAGSLRVFVSAVGTAPSSACLNLASVSLTGLPGSVAITLRQTFSPSQVYYSAIVPTSVTSVTISGTLSGTSPSSSPSLGSTVSLTAAVGLPTVISLTTTASGCASSIYYFAITQYDSVPAVTSNPSSTSVSAGSTATFTAAASGTPTPTVQWQGLSLSLSLSLSLLSGDSLTTNT